MKRIRPYRKTAVAVTGAFAAALALALGDDVITYGEWAAVAVAVLTAAGVYKVENKLG